MTGYYVFCLFCTYILAVVAILTLVRITQSANLIRTLGDSDLLKSSQRLRGIEVKLYVQQSL